MNKVLCNECNFYDDKCLLNRHGINDYQVVKFGNYIELQRSCNAFREKNYNNLEEEIIKVKEEIYQTVDIVISGDLEQNLKFYREQKINHIYIIHSPESYNPMAKNGETDIISFYGHPAESVYNKLTGRYVLFLDKYTEVNIDTINDYINTKLNNIIYMRSPDLINVQLFRNYYRKSRNYNQTLKDIKEYKETSWEDL